MACSSGFAYYVIPREARTNRILVVEQYRLMDGMIAIIRVVEERVGAPICNPSSCPTMSASGSVLFDLVVLFASTSHAEDR